MQNFVAALGLVLVSIAACAALYLFRPAPNGFGQDRTAVAQVAQPVAATVWVFPAEGEAVLMDVDIIPGVWVVPEAVFPRPKGFE